MYPEYKLYDAASRGSRDDVDAILAEDPQLIDKATFDGHTIWHMALQNKRHDLSLYILPKIAKVKSRNGKTFMHFAAEYSSLDNLKALAEMKECKADVNAKDSLGWTPLHYASSVRSIECARFLISNNAAIDVQASDGATPLMTAVRKGNDEIIDLLIDNHADCNKQDQGDNSALHYSAERGDSLIVSKLLKKKCVEHINTWLQTPLHLACANGHVECISILLQQGFRINARDSNGWTPLHHASARGHKEATLLLLRARALTELVDKQDKTPIFYAYLKSHDEIVTILLDHGAVPIPRSKLNNVFLFLRGSSHKKQLSKVLDEEDFVSLSPLSPSVTLNDLPKEQRSAKLTLSLARGTFEVSLRIVEKSVNNSKDEKYQTPIHYAVAKGNIDVVTRLLKGSNKTNLYKDISNPEYVTLKLEEQKEIISLSTDTDYATFLLTNCFQLNNVKDLCKTEIQSITTGDLEYLKQVLEENYGSNIVNTQDGLGFTPIHIASTQGYAKISLLLIAHGADFNIVTKDGKTALHLAAINDSVEIAQDLIIHNCDVNIKDTLGRTALHYAAENSSTDLNIALVNNGADIDLGDKEGRLALHYACRSNREEVLILLHQHKSDMSKEDVNGWTALHYATSRNSLNVTKLLLQYKVNVNATDKEKQTPLHHAAFQGYLEIVDILLESSANTNTQDQFGWTPLHNAASRGHTHIVKSLMRKCDINLKDLEGKSAYDYAVANNHKKISKMLKP